MLRGMATDLSPTASMVTIYNQIPELIGKIFLNLSYKYITSGLTILIFPIIETG